MKLRQWEVIYTSDKPRRRFFRERSARNEVYFFNHVARVIGEYPAKRAVMRRR